MKITAIHEYKDELDTLLRYFSEESLIIEKYQQLGGTKIKVNKLEESEDGFVVETQRDMPANVPGVLKSLLGSYNTIKHSESWHWQENGQLLCKMSVEILGVPASITGQMVFSEPHGQANIATRNVVEVEVKSSVPLIGSTLVSFICGNIKDQMDDEYHLLCKVLPQLAAQTQ